MPSNMPACGCGGQHILHAPVSRLRLLAGQSIVRQSPRAGANSHFCNHARSSWSRGAERGGRTRCAQRSTCPRRAGAAITRLQPARADVAQSSTRSGVAHAAGSGAGSGGAHTDR